MGPFPAQYILLGLLTIQCLSLACKIDPSSHVGPNTCRYVLLQCICLKEAMVRHNQVLAINGESGKKWTVSRMRILQKFFYVTWVRLSIGKTPMSPKYKVIRNSSTMSARWRRFRYNVPVHAWPGNRKWLWWKLGFNFAIHCSIELSVLNQFLLCLLKVSRIINSN